MEILDRIKSIVGVGQPTIELAPLSGPMRSGELLRGVVLLRGGDYDAPVQDVEVHLDEERLVYTTPATPERQFWKRLSELRIVMDGRILKQDETIELPFELIVPLELAPSSPAISYQLVASTEVPGLNPKAELTVVLEA